MSINYIYAQLEPTLIRLSISPVTHLNSNRLCVTQGLITSAELIIHSFPNATSWLRKSMAIPMQSLYHEHKNIRSHMNQMQVNILLMLAGPMEGSQPIEISGLAHSLKTSLPLIQ